MVSSRLRIAIADDHELFREALKSALATTAIDVVAEIGRSDDLEATLTAAPCDVLLLDLDGARSNGDVERLATQTRIVGLTDRDEPDVGLGALRAGARGVVFKRLAVRSLVECIQAVAGGLAWMPPEVQAALLTGADATPTPALTGREREVVRLVAAGLRNGEIAAQLSISELTVKSHLGNVFEKLGCRDRVELVLYARRSGLASPS